MRVSGVRLLLMLLVLRKSFFSCQSLGDLLLLEVCLMAGLLASDTMNASRCRHYADAPIMLTWMTFNTTYVARFCGSMRSMLLPKHIGIEKQLLGMVGLFDPSMDFSRVCAAVFFCTTRILFTHACYALCTMRTTFLSLIRRKR